MEGKSIVLDLLAKDQQGSRYNIEMQVRRYNEWGKRSTYYLAKMLTDQLLAGEDYSELKAVIGIHLLDFDLFSQNEHQLNQAVWRFEMRDQQQPDVKLDDVLQLNLIEMKKADRLGQIRQNLKDWITLFEHWHEDTIMASVTHEPVKKVRGYIRQLSSDEEARRLAFVRERAQRDEASQLRYARNEGIEAGKRETLHSLLEMKFTSVPDWAEQKLQAADQNQLDLWIRQVLTAESLNDLFNPS